MRKFKVHWIDGKEDFIWGPTIDQAFIRHGIDLISFQSIRYWEEVPMSAEEREFYRECGLLHDAY